MYTRILVPLDGSPQGEHALPLAAAIAEKSGATLHLVLVHEPDAYADYGPGSFEDFEEEGRAQERAYLNSVLERLTASTSVTAEVHHLEGLIEETLAKEITQREIDLVVMNAHGWGYTSRALLGSVSDYLIRRVEVPLLLMHAHDHRSGGEVGRPIALGRVLIPLDGSELAATILRPAQELADLWNAEYRLVRIVPAPSSLIGLLGGDRGAGDQALLDKPRDAAEQYLEKASLPLREHGRSVSTEVLVNRKVAAAVLEEAAAAECDLIAISTSGRGGLSRLLVGSVADKVVRGADTPVLVYRPPHG